jgi:hypothetical protein
MPTTSTEQMLAAASSGVSSALPGLGAGSWRFSGGYWGARVFFFAMLSLKKLLSAPLLLEHPFATLPDRFVH